MQPLTVAAVGHGPVIDAEPKALRKRACGPLFAAQLGNIGRHTVEDRLRQARDRDQIWAFLDGAPTKLSCHCPAGRAKVTKSLLKNLLSIGSPDAEPKKRGDFNFVSFST